MQQYWLFIKSNKVKKKLSLFIFFFLENFGHILTQECRVCEISKRFQLKFRHLLSTHGKTEIDTSKKKKLQQDRWAHIFKCMNYVAHSAAVVKKKCMTIWDTGLFCVNWHLHGTWHHYLTGTAALTDNFLGQKAPGMLILIGQLLLLACYMERGNLLYTMLHCHNT